MVLARVVAGQLPWASTRGDLSGTVAALELLGTLVSLVVWVPAEKRMGDATGLGLLVCSTNYQVSSFSLDKKLLTSYPAGAGLTDPAHQMKLRRMVMRARWPPQLQDQEAVELMIVDFRHFDPKRRFHVELKSLGLQVTDSLFAAGDDDLSVLEMAGTSAKRRVEARRQAG